MIKKLSDIYLSDREYLKVCIFIFQARSSLLKHLFKTFIFTIINLPLVYEQLAKVWLQLVQLKEEDGAEKKELVQLLQTMTQLLSDCITENEKQDNETQQHVSLAQLDEITETHNL